MCLLVTLERLQEINVLDVEFKFSHPLLQSLMVLAVECRVKLHVDALFLGHILNHSVERLDLPLRAAQAA